MKIGFIGTGVMGNAISVNLLKAGYEMVVYNRTKSKTDNLVSLGASWADSPKEVARQSDIIFTMVGFPPMLKMYISILKLEFLQELNHNLS